MQYIINGILEPVFRKTILYGSHSIVEFKQKLKIYDKIQHEYENTKFLKLKPEVPCER